MSEFDVELMTVSIYQVVRHCYRKPLLPTNKKELCDGENGNFFEA